MSIGFIEALKPVSTALITTLITGLFLVPKLEVFFNTTSIYLAVITLILVRVSIFASFLNVTLLGSLAITIVTALISLLLGLTLGASFLATYYITT